eukprot:SAG31_NODE_238_length_19470_cov_8.921532_3_plen_113_part_00
MRWAEVLEPYVNDKIWKNKKSSPKTPQKATGGDEEEKKALPIAVIHNDQKITSLQDFKKVLELIDPDCGMTERMRLEYNKNVAREYVDSGQRYAIVLADVMARVGEVSWMLN